MSELLQDMRFALRTLSRGWLVTTVAVVSLALAIGGNAAVFSMVDAFIFRPLPYPEPELLVLVGERDEDQPEGQGGSLATSLPTYADLAERSQTLATWGAMQPRTLSVRGSDRADAVSGVAATPSFFDVMQVSAARGRTFLDEEGRVGAGKVALLSHEYWVRSFDDTGDPLGQVLTIDGEPHEVVGLLPEGFEFLTPNQDIWVPLARSAAETPRDQQDLIAVARMRPGATMDQVRAELAAVFERLSAEHPEALNGRTADVYNLRYDLPTKQTRILFGLLQGSVFLVLLIACVNITNLLLARGQDRAREIALRTVLGAGRIRIVRQLLTESSLMVFVAAALGLGLGAVGIRLTANQWATVLPAQYQLALDERVLAFTIGVSVLAGLAFGLVPAFQTFKEGQVQALKEGGRGSGKKRKTLSKLLVVGEIALSFVALGGGALLMRSFLDLRDSDPGFETASILTGLITVPDAKRPDDEQKLLLAEQILERARSVTGVVAAAFTNSLPQNFQAPTDSFRVAGEAVDPQVRAPSVLNLTVSPGYLETLGIELLQGRFLEASDRLGGPPVVVVNRTLAARFEGRSALGERLELGGELREIVGVVDNVKQVAFATPSTPEASVYVPLSQEPGARWLMVRTAGDPELAKEPLRLAVEELDPDLTLSQVRTMDEFIAQFFVGIAVFNTVLGAFGLMALVMASLGTYGVLAYSVGQRSHEIGIRLAVGARPRQVVRLIAREGITLGAVGLVLGVLMTLPLIGVMTSLLQGLSSVKPVTLVFIGTVLFAVTIVASLLPAGRAAAVDPVRTLREE